MTIFFLIPVLVIHYSVFLITACGCAIYSLELLRTQSSTPQDMLYGAKLQVWCASLLWASVATKCSENVGTSALFPSFLGWQYWIGIHCGSVQQTFVGSVSKHALYSGDEFFNVFGIVASCKDPPSWWGRPASKEIQHRAVSAEVCGTQRAKTQKGGN